jgi:hypothetical protein
MKPTRTRLVAVAAALSTIALAAPLSTASADTTARAFGPGPLLAAGWAGSPAVALPFSYPVFGQTAAVIGPTIITTAPSVFVNTNNQVSAGSNLSGGQVGW